MTPPPHQSARARMPDYLRLLALFGIVVVNVQYIAFSALHGFADPVGDSARDAITLWLVNGLALLKTYGLFSCSAWASGSSCARQPSGACPSGASTGTG